MKAVFANTMFSLVCFASFVLAAPHQSAPVTDNACLTPAYATCMAVPAERRCCKKQKVQVTAPVTHDSDSFLSW